MWLRLRQIALVAEELEPVLEQFRQVLGLEVCFRDKGVAQFGLENALLPVGNQFLEVVAPVAEGTTAGRYLERRRGDGGYMVITQCDTHPPRRARVKELGIREVFSFERDDYVCMQLHPKDTGGSFFEIDEQRGTRAHDVDGPWEPAGNTGWESARRTDRVDAIVAAEIQAEHPAQVAKTWGDIAEIAVGSRDDGSLVMPLDNAEVRFVPATDGRGDGLGGISLRATDADAVLTAAAGAGVPIDGRTVTLCGMRMTLV
ncbi:MAG: VOC family protein [Acidimicrobiales bacterium]